MEKLDVAVVGFGGGGIRNVVAVNKTENIVALCEVDSRAMDRMGQRVPRARQFVDFRRLFDKQKSLDAVVISTPDHTHYHIAAAAIERGLHVYCEKPLAHNVREVRAMVRAARKHRVVTQMGNQHHSSRGYRRAAALVQFGAIGRVREVHCWTSRPIWPQGIGRPKNPQPQPDYLNWDLWLGPAPDRPYHEAYHPYRWRGWWDFGTGALGDMGPHLIDPAMTALKLTAPRRIAAESAPVNNETAPQWSIVTFEFPAREQLPPVKLIWYDGGKRPPREVTGVARPPSNGTLLLGSRARLFIPELGRPPIVIPLDKNDRIEQPEVTPDASPGHHAEWIAACKTGNAPSSNFEYGAQLTETCLLGNIAIRAKKPLVWDAENGRAVDCPEAEPFVGREYRRGWQL